ncbi:hypothetical protein QWY31_16440 [Cytophagales bacterium LB-30]|uniref:Uncharacterized protein n=1 Tax=Shiella aurantiaca TaxID=3058365 RepID=A0ABT8F9F4_9BACT|nr:hypothetical protein [Shiella aurantiaca]MDN4167101.1 hypothetical protein [Shiella aurantiaca]
MSEDEIILIEILLRKMIIQYNIDAEKKFVMMDSKFPKYGLKLKDFTIELDDYGRQFMAVISDEGKKIVYVGCFCDPKKFGYRTKELVQVMDGGKCYFEFKIDLETRQIFEFSENGVG